jgi:hypothetical protein
MSWCLSRTLIVLLAAFTIASALAMPHSQSHLRFVIRRWSMPLDAASRRPRGWISRTPIRICRRLRLRPYTRSRWLMTGHALSQPFASRSEACGCSSTPSSASRAVPTLASLNEPGPTSLRSKRKSQRARRVFSSWRPCCGRRMPDTGQGPDLSRGPPFLYMPGSPDPAKVRDVHLRVRLLRTRNRKGSSVAM